MPNSLSTVAEKFSAKLDAVIEAELKTADLTINKEFQGDYVGAGKIEIANIAMQGLGDYANGFPTGDITLTWEQFALSHDRAREFQVDNMQDDDRAGVISANLMGEFVRTKVVPEVDAIRFATLYTKAGQKPTGANITTADGAVSALETAEEYFEAMGIEANDLVLYCTANFKGLIKAGMPYRIENGTDPDRRFMTVDGIKVVVVPDNRFYTAIDLKSGGSGEEAGGYAKTSTGKGINFILCAPKSVSAVQKHEAVRYFAPEVNQDADAHKWQYRIYHDLIVPTNAQNAIYAHCKA